MYKSLVTGYSISWHPLWGCVTSEAVNRCCVIHFGYSLGEEVVFSSLPTLSLCVFLALMWIVVYSWRIFWGPHLYWATKKLSVVRSPSWAPAVVNFILQWKLGFYQSGYGPLFIAILLQTCMCLVLLKLGPVNKLQAMQHCFSTYLLTERGKHKNINAKKG